MDQAPKVPQYQNFPDASGDSDSLAKLKALRLPALAYKSFLDIGCNEGFFCGYALFDGASRVVGIDASPLYIERARARFPAADFLCQNWDVLPTETFDVILLASSLHYAVDQSALIHRLMQSLNPDGTLVLELGVHDSGGKQWVEVQRGRDTRSYPTWPKLSEVLETFAWKVIGNSVNQRGDPVARHVIHITHRKPLIYLMMQASGSGKTSVARNLFMPAGVPIISGDAVLAAIAARRLDAPDELKAIVGPDLDHTRLDEIYRKVFRAGLFPQLIKVWLTKAGGSTFALDAYIPQDRLDEVAASLNSAGFVVVMLTMSGVTGLEPLEHRHSSAQNYFNVLNNRNPQSPNQDTVSHHKALPFTGTVGFVDSVEVDDRFVKIEGWAVHESGVAAEQLDVHIDGVSVQHHVASFDRPDIQQRLQLDHGQVGFRITIPTPPALVRHNLAPRVQVYASIAGETASQPLWSIPAHILPDTLTF